MSKTFQHTLWVSVLLASGVLVTGCQSEKKNSSAKTAEETATSKAERAPPPAESRSLIDRIFSPSSKPATPPASVAETKPNGAKPTAHKLIAHAKPTAQAETKTAGAGPAKPSDTNKPSFTSYGEGAAGAGITDPKDTTDTIRGSTSSSGK